MARVIRRLNLVEHLRSHIAPVDGPLNDEEHAHAAAAAFPEPADGALLVGVVNSGAGEERPFVLDDEEAPVAIPASIWKTFMTQAAPILAAENQVPEKLRQAQKQEENLQPTPPGRNAADRGDGSKQDQCDFRACGAKYQSFDPADCTYLPYGGRSRRRCQISADAVRQAAAASTPATDGQIAAGRCNIDICARAYSSFRTSDCTYQPFDGGPRRMCER